MCKLLTIIIIIIIIHDDNNNGLYNIYEGSENKKKKFKTNAMGSDFPKIINTSVNTDIKRNIVIFFTISFR